MKVWELDGNDSFCQVNMLNDEFSSLTTSSSQDHVQQQKNHMNSVLLSMIVSILMYYR